MKNFSKLFCAIFIFVSVPFFAQEMNSIESIPMEVLMENSLKISLDKSIVQESRNQVFIDQVGKGNVASSAVVSERSDIRLNQEGDYNFVGILARVNSMEAEITQNGNGNKSFSFVIDPNEDVSLNLTQYGNESHFESYGSNSISNKLQFETNGDYKSIIVRNFK